MGDDQYQIKPGGLVQMKGGAEYLLVRKTRCDKGKPKSPAHRAAISAALKGRPKTSEQRAKVSGENHYNWKGGVRASIYRGRAFSNAPPECNRCGKREGELQVHHIDQDRYNSDPANLEILCPRCHMREHREKRVDWECVGCGKRERMIPFRAGRRKFCSSGCFRSSGRNEKGQFVGR